VRQYTLEVRLAVTTTDMRQRPFTVTDEVKRLGVGILLNGYYGLSICMKR